MKYKLKEHVTDEMLIEMHFRIVIDRDIRAIRTLENRSIFIEHNGEVLAWQQKDVQPYIDLDYVEVVE
jgi:hypothetical protein